MLPMNMTWPRIAAFLLMLALLITPEARAQTATRKFVRGFAAMTTGFLEVPGNMTAETRAHGPAEGLPLGFVKGLGMIVVRELVGVYEFLSAPFPAPEGYRPIIHPEFPWSYFEGEEPPPPPPPHPRGRTHRS
jgi:putative exosortase-associated protein (TIGR04073 family)